MLAFLSTMKNGIYKKRPTRLYRIEKIGQKKESLVIMQIFLHKLKLNQMNNLTQANELQNCINNEKLNEAETC